MTSNGSTSGFLLRVTLTKTLNPTVTREIAIPGDITFEELHDSIAAAFKWKDPEEPYPLKISTVDEHNGALTAYFTKPGKGYETTPALLHTSTPISEMFNPSNLSYGRYWTYNYGLSRYHHAIELEHASANRIRCVGGQGHISHKAWQFGDVRRANDVTGQIKSISEMDEEEDRERLAVVQEAYEQRKIDEAGENAEERPSKKSKTQDVRSLVGKEEETLFLSDNEGEST